MDKILRKILLALASVFLIWQTYETLKRVDEFELESWGVILFMAWLISLYITGIFAFLGFAFPTQNLMPDSYYQVTQPKKLKKIYRFLKVEIFRKALLATLWRNQKQREKFFNGTSEGIENLETQSKKSEFGHLIPLVLIFILVIYFFGIGQTKLAILTFLINILGGYSQDIGQVDKLKQLILQP